MHPGKPLHLNYQQIGTGPALIILHGLFGSGTNWRSIARGLSDCREIFLPDARNHGASEHAEGMDYLTLAQDTVDFMDSRDLAAADIIGHSMGGKTAMHLALKHPCRVRSLLVVDIAPVASPGDHLPLMDALQALPLEQMQQRSDADRALAGTVSDAGLRAFLLQNLIIRSNSLRWRINTPAIRSAMADLIAFPQPAPGACYMGPVLFLRGGRSEYIQDVHKPLIRRYFPTARINTMAGAGHWPHAERPAAFITECRAFLGCPAL